MALPPRVCAQTEAVTHKIFLHCSSRCLGLTRPGGRSARSVVANSQGVPTSAGAAAAAAAASGRPPPAASRASSAPETVESSTSAPLLPPPPLLPPSEPGRDVASAWREQLQVGEAEGVHRLALDRAERQLGRSHHLVVYAAENLAAVLKQRSGYDGGSVVLRQEAERLFQRAAEARQTVPWPEDALDAEAALALVLGAPGSAAAGAARRQLAVAEARYSHDLATRELGDDDFLTLYARDNLAALLVASATAAAAAAGAPAARGSGGGGSKASSSTASAVCDEAVALLRQCLALRERQLGTHHQYTATAMINLAEALLLHGRLLCTAPAADAAAAAAAGEEAETLMRRALEVQETLLGGAGHPAVHETFTRLEDLLQFGVGGASAAAAAGSGLPLLGGGGGASRGAAGQRRPQEAEQLLLHQLEAQFTALGPAHLRTQLTMARLESHLSFQGRRFEAAAIARALDASAGRDVPPSRLSTFQSETLLRQGRRGEESKLLQERLAVRERLLGPDHPLTARSRRKLAALMQHQGGRTAEAEALLRQAVTSLQRVHGEPDQLAAPSTCSPGLKQRQQQQQQQQKHCEGDHPDLVDAWNDLAELLLARSSQAGGGVPMLQAPASDSSTGAPQARLADALGEAERLCRQALAACERLYGFDEQALADSLALAGRTTRSINNLVAALMRAGKWEEAEAQCRVALAALHYQRRGGGGGGAGAASSSSSGHSFALDPVNGETERLRQALVACLARQPSKALQAAREAAVVVGSYGWAIGSRAARRAEVVNGRLEHGELVQELVLSLVACYLVSHALFSDKDGMISMAMPYHSPAATAGRLGFWLVSLLQVLLVLGEPACRPNFMRLQTASGRF